MGPQERTIFIAFSCVAAFLGVVIFIFFYNMYRQHRKYNQLQVEKLNAEIIATETERNNIATELHNDIGPFLSSLKMRLDIIHTDNSDDIEACKLAIDKSVSQIRAMAKSLAPLSIFNISFQEALSQYIEEVNFRNLLKIDYIELDKVVLPQEQNNHVYRILQEIIQNTIKHAQATELRIEISKTDHLLFIRTSDNGIGFDLQQVRAHQKLGLGLLGIQNRIDFLNGTLSSSDELSKGTRYNIRIPISS